MIAPVRKSATLVRPDRQAALQSVRNLIAWIGDDPDRADLVDTPERLLGAFSEWFSGYGEDPQRELGRVFDKAPGDDFVLLRGIEVESHCEHHMAPFRGTATVAYIPRRKVVGISKLARAVDVLSRRLQNQEALTAQIADTVEAALRPDGVAVIVAAEHECMSTRGVRQQRISTVTTRFRGLFEVEPELRSRFMSLSDMSCGHVRRG